jgi:predicted amino acid dehydrogenase
VLALEGRFEVFTIGRDTEWEKVKEIYQAWASNTA